MRKAHGRDEIRDRDVKSYLSRDRGTADPELLRYGSESGIEVLCDLELEWAPGRGISDVSYRFFCIAVTLETIPLLKKCGSR